MPDTLFTHAEWLRRWQKKSRSVLYRDALAEYLERHYGNAITESINQVVDDPEAADPELDAFAAEAARRILMQVEWAEIARAPVTLSLTPSRNHCYTQRDFGTPVSSLGFTHRSSD